MMIVSISLALLSKKKSTTKCVTTTTKLPSQSTP